MTHEHQYWFLFAAKEPSYGVKADDVENAITKFNSEYEGDHLPVGIYSPISDTVYQLEAVRAVRITTYPKY